MIVRVVTYHALPGMHVEEWMASIASTVRGVAGLRHVEFIQSQDDPTQYGAIQYFQTLEDLNNYKTSETLQYLVQSMRDWGWLDELEPVHEHIFDVLNIEASGSFNG